ncbi:MAG: FAD:protein FMN transferase [Proteobacteria bacterium]|nr:FAD:protein FMN transferase [Pseudomonadota bacterium]
MRALAAGLSLLSCASAPALPELVSDGRYTMGTVLEISLVADAATAQRDLDAAFARVTELDALLSRYQPESDVVRLARLAGRGPQPVDPATAVALRQAVEYGRLTGGSFDVTVGPLVELWTRAADRGVPPTPDEIASARERVGADRLRIGPGHLVALPRAGMSLDLGGFAKGFALDEVARLLRAGSALLSFGQSSVWALGAPPGKPGWRLLMRAPDGSFAGAVTLRDCAFSVSSSFGRSSVIGGRRYGHVVDPRTGRALERSAQASVVAPSAALAEVLSTALLILEPDRGLALVESLPDVEGMIADAAGTVASSGWEDATHFEPAPVSARRSLTRVDWHLWGTPP